MMPLIHCHALYRLRWLSPIAEVKFMTTHTPGIRHPKILCNTKAVAAFLPPVHEAGHTILRDYRLATPEARHVQRSTKQQAVNGIDLAIHSEFSRYCQGRAPQSFA